MTTTTASMGYPVLTRLFSSRSAWTNKGLLSWRQVCHRSRTTDRLKQIMEGPGPLRSAVWMKKEGNHDVHNHAVHKKMQAGNRFGFACDARCLSQYRWEYPGLFASDRRHTLRSR